MPRYLRSEHPGSTQLVLELDPLVIDVAERRLGFVPATTCASSPVTRAAASSALAADARGTGDPEGVPFDLVIGDAFGGIAVPWHLTTREFTADLHALMAPEGLYLLNVIDHGPRDFLRAEVATIADVFAHVAVLERGDGRGGNHVVIASDRRCRSTPSRRATARARVTTCVAGAALRALVGDAAVLTDDRAPVDQLLTPRPPAGAR
jgi:hypothetical protein